ncbi:hypothetical protein GGQ74_000584 [Desulfobaculum xiamenense]|uniref:Uncharacterized protein n=1 Tax=Desulfobaculum xiamenense TaxID=995050 RepID=A0A846QP06_9BACT|nr:hypothetical protein [Desulfobaculum xiamenense]NJB66944.1 hypothetical protein [Desulfobaculum xiamenense]
MPDAKLDSTDIRRKSDSVLDNLITGLKVLADETKWIVLKGLRAVEIRQMEKRLESEYAAIGRHIHDGIVPGEDGRKSSGTIPPVDDDLLLSLKQIEFLREEIDYLRNERTRVREALLKARVQDLGLKSDE